MHVSRKALFLILFLVSACGSTKPNPENGAITPDISELPLMYPHAENWEYPNTHGEWAVSYGPEKCLACHKKESAEAETTPTCASCHPLYPHDADWETGHGAAFQEKGEDACATMCHGTDLGGGLSGVACSSCHASYPHVPGWADASGHGAYVVDNGLASCQTKCHGSDLSGGTTGISCASCHASYPHAGGWGGAEGHGAFVIDNGWEGCATRCHGTDLAGGDSGVSCNSCHEGYPHKDPDWMADGRASAHANTFIAKIRAGQTSACTKCHGGSYDRAIKGVSCVTCHTGGVTHKADWSSAGHGAYYSSRFTSLSDTYCKDCHGALIDFADGQTRDELTSQSDCYRCHWSYPHKAYHWGGSGDVVPWEPTGGDPPSYGHMTYLSYSTLFTNSSGYHPTGMRDPEAVAAIQNTCAGDRNGVCHFNGYRSTVRPLSTPLCGGYCHH